MSRRQPPKQTVYGPGQSTFRPGGTITSRKTTISNQSKAGKSNNASSRSLLGGSSTKKNVLIPDKFTDRARYLGVVVYDDEGNDVTPKPLVIGETGATRQQGQRNNIFGGPESSGAATPSEMSQSGTYQGTYQRSAFAGGGGEEKTDPKSEGSFSDDWLEPTEMTTSGLGDIRHVQRVEVPEVLTEADLEEEVTLTLTETECDFLFDLEPITVHMESDEAQHVRERNARYAEDDPKAKLVRNRVGNDRYTERWMQTINEAPKLKAIQTDKINFSDVGSTATTWDMYDTYKKADDDKKKEEEDEEDDLMAMAKPKPKMEEEEEPEAAAQEVTAVETATPAASESDGRDTRSSTVTSISDSVFGLKEASAEDGQPAGPKTVSTSVLKKDTFQRDLFVMERVINLNTYQPRLAAYRGFPVISDLDRNDGVVDMGMTLRPTLDRLWVYGCPLTEGRTISSMAWNKANPDIIAVGYGELSFGEQKGGMACCWSLKNPKYPERIFTNASGITAMDFSEMHPNLLAVGLYDGSVVVYNVRMSKDEPVLDSLLDMRSEVGGKHTSPVWHLRWIEKERGVGEERQEILVSISTDGRVTQWMIRKGFECSDLMKLKRVAPKPGFSITGGRREKKGEAFIARQAGGMCFDFSPRDSNLYLAGTEEGHIHKCSCSYNEQYLDTYWGHTGPVYRIQWSPFMPDVFLSCSGDWSMRLWQQERMSPIINFFSGTKAVYDISWSPQASTVFAAVNEAEVQIWDLSQNTLDPVIVQKPTASTTKLTAVIFASNSESVLVGDSEGQVTVYQLKGMPLIVKDKSHQEEALNKILSSTLASQLAAQATKIKAEKKTEVSK